MAKRISCDRISQPGPGRRRAMKSSTMPCTSRALAASGSSRRPHPARRTAPRPDRSRAPAAHARRWPRGRCGPRRGRGRQAGPYHGCRCSRLQFPSTSPRSRRHGCTARMLMRHASVRWSPARPAGAPLHPRASRRRCRRGPRHLRGCRGKNLAALRRLSEAPCRRGVSEAGRGAASDADVKNPAVWRPGRDATSGPGAIRPVESRRFSIAVPQDVGGAGCITCRAGVQAGG